MSLRVSLLGIVWFFTIILLFITPLYVQPELLFGIVPLRSIVHLFVFWGFSHAWIVALKKQFSFKNIRSNAFIIVLLSSVLIALIGEICVYTFSNYPSLQFWNLGMDIVGTLLSGISFRLLYNASY